MAIMARYSKKENAIMPVITKHKLAYILKKIGLHQGDYLFVECNDDFCAKVVGGARTIIETLQEVIGYNGCIMLSGESLGLIDPLSSDEKFNPELYEGISNSIAAYNKRKDLPNNKLASVFACYEGVARSDHPYASFLIWGKRAKLFSNKHPLHFPYGVDSPFERLVKQHGKLLLLNNELADSIIFKYLATIDTKVPTCIKASPIEYKGHRQVINILDKEKQVYDSEWLKPFLKARNQLEGLMDDDWRCYLISLPSTIEYLKQKNIF